MDDWQELIVSIVAFPSLALVGAAVLAALLFTNSIRRPWLPLQRLPRVPWKGIDVFLAFVILDLVAMLVHQTLVKADVFAWLYENPAEASTKGKGMLLSAALARPLALAIVVLGLRQFRAARLSDFGITSARAGTNAAVGYVLWLALWPAAIAVQYVATLATPLDWQEAHDIARVAEQPLASAEWLLLFVVVMVVAPLSEEFMFRGLLLRWQLRAGWEGQATVALCALFFAVAGGIRENKDFNPAPVIFVLALLPGVFLVPFLRRRTPPASSEAEGQGTDSRQPIPAGNQPGLAIFSNALLFAAMHGAWPSPIPLLLLGVGLAWLTYRTSSLVGALTIHVLFNGASALGLLLYQLW